MPTAHAPPLTANAALAALIRFREAYFAAADALRAEARCPLDLVGLVRSPYTSAQRVHGAALADGLLIMCLAEGPGGHWYVDGGPAVKVDFAHTRTPLQVRVMLARRGPTRPVRGLVRVVAPDDLPVDIWHGVFGPPEGHCMATWGDGVEVRVEQFPFGLCEALQRATFGFYWDSASLAPLARANGESIELVRGLGFFPADLAHKRFFEHLQIARPAAQTTDLPSATLQHSAEAELRRDLARTLAMARFRGDDALRQLTQPTLWAQRLRQRLTGLQGTVAALEAEMSQGSEAALRHALQREPLTRHLDRCQTASAPALLAALRCCSRMFSGLTED